MIECDITKPYLFISYSHKNINLLTPIVNELIKRGYRLWYDDGIHLGDEWPETVAEFLKNAYCVLFLVSQAFCLSRNCRREVNYAVDKDKEMFAIYIEDCERTPGLDMQLGSIQSFTISDGDSVELVERFLRAPIFSNPKLLLSLSEADSFQSALLSENSLVHSQTVAIGILRHEDSVLMLRRQNPEGNLIWGFPTSNIKPNEDPRSRIIKEFYSETGIRTRVLKQLGSRLHPDTKALCYYYALEYVDGILENRDDYENAEARWVTIADYQSFISTNLFQPVMQYLSEQPIEVVMCIVTFEGKILLVHRADKDPKLSWAFPGGTVEIGESIFQTAIRELKEETNIDGEIVQLIGDRIHPYSKKHMAYVALRPKSFDILIGDDDLDMCQWFDINELGSILGSSIYEKVNIYLSQVLE